MTESEEVEAQAEVGQEESSLAGKKRLRPVAFNAVKKGEIENSVELAYLQRPHSPKNYRIYSDK